jgi:hypothetical protein
MTAMVSERDLKSRDGSRTDDSSQVCAAGGALSREARCDACGAPMKPMGHCKYWCLACGFLRTCNDTI